MPLRDDDGPQITINGSLYTRLLEELRQGGDRIAKLERDLKEAKERNAEELKIFSLAAENRQEQREKLQQENARLEGLLTEVQGQLETVNDEALRLRSGISLALAERIMPKRITEGDE